MRLDRWLIGAASGVGVALVIGVDLSAPPAARGERSRAGLRVVSVNVWGDDQVALNHVIDIRLSARVSRRSLTNGSIAVHPFDTVTGELGKARPGELRRRGNVVRFIPKLPTHVRDTDDPAGDFFPPGSSQDDAFENGSLRVATDYVVRIAGQSDQPAAASASRGRLPRTVLAGFRTADGTSKDDPVFLADIYDGVRLPAVAFTSPPDRVASAASLYQTTGGTPAVPRDVEITLFGSGVPLDPRTLREEGVVELTQVAIEGDPITPTPVPGHVVVDQDRNRTRLVFRPDEPLAERSTFALRVTDSVTDLTGDFLLVPSIERGRLADAYSFLAATRDHNAGVPVELLPDPSVELIFDWPSVANREERGVLKRNLVNLGDTRPWEVDSRVFAVFTTGTDETAEPSPPVDPPTNAPRRRAPLAEVAEVVTPLGLQGAEGAGSNVVLPFTLVDLRGRPAFVEIEYGTDLDADGAIEDDEFRRASIDTRDPRYTGATRRSRGRRGRSFHEFFAAPGTGRSNALVWNSQADVGRGSFIRLDVVRTAQGRAVRDADGPVVAPGEGGIILRLRAVRGARRVSAWVRTAPFELTNASRPSITIEAIRQGNPISIDWIAFNPDSEDSNGNGVLEFAEDGDLDGAFDIAPSGVAFDFHLLGDGVDPTSLTTSELATLAWSPCSRSSGIGDPDEGLATAPVGRAYTFAWDRTADAVEIGTRVILRGQPFDANGVHGAWVYVTEPTTIGE